LPPFPGVRKGTLVPNWAVLFTVLYRKTDSSIYEPVEWEALHESLMVIISLIISFIIGYAFRRDWWISTKRTDDRGF